MSLISENLSKILGRRQVVSQVSLCIHPGQVVGLFGANGAGKTTTFLMMAGLLLPDKGSIFLNNQDITGFPLYRRARMGLRYLPQESSIFRGLTVEENLQAAFDIVGGTPSSQVKHSITELLELFHLENLRNRAARVLSGGQRRRVEIARALIGQPQFLMLDEPLAGIDPRSIHEVGQLIKTLAHRGLGVLTTDHNVRDMLPLVDYAYVMHEGQVLSHGTPQQVSDDALVRQAYLGSSFQYKPE